MNTTTFSVADLALAIASSPDTQAVSWVRLLDLSNGQLLGTVQVGYNPMAVLRKSKAELLVSDVTVEARGKARSILRVLDLQNGLSTKAEIPLPNRIEYTIFSPGLALSQNEFYAYYLKRASCSPGPLCDEYSVGVIDLEAGKEVASASLPRNCGFALLTPRGASTVLAMCPEISSLFEITPAGVTTPLASFTRPPREAAGEGVLAWPIYGGVVNNTHYMIFDDGTAQFQSGAGTDILKVDLLPQRNLRFNGIQRWQLDDQRAILGFSEDAGEVMTGAILFDASVPALPRILRLPLGTGYLAPMGSSKIAALHQGGVSVIDLNTGLETAGPFEAPPGSQWLLSSSN
jgi:hypothetical protein